MHASLKRKRAAGGPRAGRNLLARLAGASALVLLTGNAWAQAQPPPAPAPEDPAQSSVEQGHTELGESFETEDDRRDRIAEQRREAFEDTTFDVQGRTYLLDRNKYDDSEIYAWAIGGSAGLKTGYFRDRFAFGLTAYTSQPLDAPDDKDGTLLLASGQEGYEVLGESYLQVRLADGINLNAGRKRFSTPYINDNDVRMTPNTFEALAVQGLRGTQEMGEWRWGAGYFHDIKERNSEDFVSMATDAGAPAGVERGVYSVGGNYTKGALSVGAIDYYSDDLINIFYTEASYKFPLAEKRDVKLSAQYSDQQAVGSNLLRGADFSADQLGLRAELTLGPTLLTAAYTTTGDGTNMQNPWSGYPGYTSVQVEDFNRAGEDAWMLRFGYKFAAISGLSAYGLWVNGSDPDSPTDFARDEYNLNVQWSPDDGVLKGLMFRVRYSRIDQDNDTDQDDFRVMVFYDPPKL